MYCLQWLMPIFLIPKQLVHPAFLIDQALFLWFYIAGFVLERRNNISNFTKKSTPSTSFTTRARRSNCQQIQQKNTKDDGDSAVDLDGLDNKDFSDNDGSIEGTSNSTSPIYTIHQLNNNNDSSLITSILQEIQLPHDGSDDSSFAPQIDNQSIALLQSLPPPTEEMRYRSPALPLGQDLHLFIH
uniref:Uncharacterized protein n=1 Tax=Meloidogyne enterolobii TaxID=390850 RepID=A0A6V7VXY3_MELEN|nr:unnamed protein product [Meloidogyne enterolobii]